MVEQAHSCLTRYPKLLGRFEKLAVRYDGLLELACALIAFRQLRISSKYEITGNSTLPEEKVLYSGPWGTSTLTATRGDENGKGLQ